MKTFTETLDYLYTALPMYQRIGNAAYKKDLTNTIALCEALGNPQNKFKSVHIAGTNGKGSSAHMIAAILQSAGYKTGLYTSPHLKSFTERIRVNGQEVSRDEVVRFVEVNKATIQSIQPSFFEITVAMAFDCFAREEVDIAVIEVGLGGRLDSTNVISPEVSLITNIGLDHQDMLGDTLEQIAAEKAGIIKKKVPIVIGQRQPEAEQVFIEKARSVGAPIRFAEDDSAGKGLQLQLKGNYQQHNVVGVLGTIDQLVKKGFAISDEHIKYGLAHTIDLTGIKGRWQVLQTQPLMICDTGHNIDGVKFLVKQINQISYDKLHIVWGMVKDKDADQIFDLLPEDAEYYFCQAKVPRAMPVGRLIDQAHHAGLSGIAISDVYKAIDKAKESASQNDLIFIGGSSFVVAEISEL